jgi:hypothetical protein
MHSSHALFPAAHAHGRRPQVTAALAVSCTVCHMYVCAQAPSRAWTHLLQPSQPALLVHSCCGELAYAGFVAAWFSACPHGTSHYMGRKFAWPSLTLCFCICVVCGAPLVRHPIRYTSLLADKLQQHSTQAWLVNTGAQLPALLPLPVGTCMRIRTISLRWHRN